MTVETVFLCEIAVTSSSGNEQSYDQAQLAIVSHAQDEYVGSSEGERRRDCCFKCDVS